MSNYSMILTKVGLAKVTNAQLTNENVLITHFVVGDGDGANYVPTQEMVALKNEKWRGAVSSVEIDKDNPHWIIVTGAIPAKDGGFMIREAGLIDKDGDLVAIGNTPETYKPLQTEGAAKDLILKQYIEVSNATNVTLQIDPTVIIASREYVDKKVGKTEMEVIEARADFVNLHERLDNMSSLSLGTQSRLTSNVKTRPLITFIDDDGGKQVYTKLKPIFEARGVPCTIALLSSHVQTGTTLTLNQAKELQDVLGWEIASHGHAQVQLNDLTEEQVITQLTVSKNYFSRNGINAENYVYGFGYPNAKTRDLVRRYYQCGVDSQLNENGGINKVPLAQYKIARVGLGSFDGDRTLDDYKAFIDRAITESGWVIFMLHVDGTDEQGLQDLADTIDYAISRNVDIVNLNDALEVFGNNIFVGDYAGNLQNDKYHIVAKSGETYTNNMPKTSITIDTPITHFSFGQTIKHFVTKDNTGFPGETGGSGTLITNRAQQEVAGDDSLSTQIFIPFGKNEFYMRHAEYGGATKWSEFTRITNEDINPIINRYTSTTPPSSFPLWETTTFYYNATGQGAFPVSTGVVTTYRIQNATDKAFTYQMLKSYVGNRLFLRTAKDDDTWQTWSEIDPPDITPTRNAYSNATPPSGFPDWRVTIFYFNSGGSQGFPTTAGVVHTYIIKDSYDKGYSYQELKVYKQNVKYTRYELSDDKWSDWELVGSVSPSNP